MQLNKTIDLFLRDLLYNANSLKMEIQHFIFSQSNINYKIVNEELESKF